MLFLHLWCEVLSVIVDFCVRALAHQVILSCTVLFQLAVLSKSFFGFGIKKTA